MPSPQVKAGIRRFRAQKRAFWSLIVIVLLFLLTLPAELLCNNRPIFIRYRGRSYFPFFRTYTEADFGGKRKIRPDYTGRRFLELLGHGSPEEEDLPDTAARDAAKEDSGLLDLFDSEESEMPPPPAPAEPLAILNDFDPEPRDVDPVEVAARPQEKASAPAWILWPPIRYDYAHISHGSASGRDALASPWGQVIPATGKVYGSSWADGHYLGTDDRGRDVLARLVYGFRVSMLFGLLLALSSTVVGCALGAVQGFFGGLTDLLGQRFTEIWGSLPQLYLLMILSSILARNIYVLFAILNLTSWMGMAAYMRAEFLRGRKLDYVTAARGLGASNGSIMFHHILPNSLTPVITFLPFSITGGILALASLDFLNLGVPSPYPSLGELLAQGQGNLQAVWIIVPTFIVLSGTITLLTFVGDGLRNAFDPRKAVD